LFARVCRNFIAFKAKARAVTRIRIRKAATRIEENEGETHVEFGAKIMSLFGKEWSDFSMYHSRYYAKKYGAQPSKLCFADKLSFAVTPRWLYLPAVNATGEIHEYLKNAKKAETEHWKPVEGQKAWHSQLCKYMTKWVEEHKDGSVDTWTNSNRHIIIDVDHGN